ncbi:MAG: RIP metalloprotease RseP [Calothrix sp. SM1_5_4]|nr:RIP metalloprotease RseP [Calothrix sp. SM1_5_4]
MSIFNQLFENIAPFFILLGVLIFVHELGHFLVAKFFGVRVEVFSLGFGKKVLSFTRGETTYCISLIPLGGYVKMYGDDPTADVPPEERGRAFLHKPVLQRIAIVLAGPLMNLFFAVFVFTLIGGIGEELPGPYAGDIQPGTKAYDAGFRSGDKILAINGVNTPTWVQVRRALEASGGKAVSFTVERQSEPQPLQLEASVSFGENENIFSSDRQVGMVPGLGQESRSTIIGVADPKSPAAQAGLRSLDMIVSVAGKKLNYWRELQPAFAAALTPGQSHVTVEVRDLAKDEKSENIRSVKLAVPSGWDEKTDFLSVLGLEPAELYIYQIKKDSPADKAGIRSRDKVIRIGGEDVHAWNDVLNRVKAFDPVTEGMDITVLRDGAEQTFRIVPEMTKLMTPKGQEEKRFTIGIVSGFFPVGAEPVLYRVTNPVQMFTHGVRETLRWTEFVVMSVVRLVEGDVSAKNIGGVITIGRVASHSFAAGLSTFLKTMAIISINLFLLNLLPVPILDGGHLVFYTIEGLRGAPLSMRKMEVAQQIGLMLLMFLMVFAFFNDITNYISTRW